MLCIARPKPRARIETSPANYVKRFAAVSPGLNPGRGLKPDSHWPQVEQQMSIARPKPRARIETCVVSELPNRTDNVSPGLNPGRGLKPLIHVEGRVIASYRPA